MDKKQDQKPSLRHMFTPSSKIAIAISIGCVIVLLITKYAIQMSGDPGKAADTAIAVSILMITIALVGFVSLRTIDSYNLHEVKEECRRALQAETILKKEVAALHKAEREHMEAETNYFIQAFTSGTPLEKSPVDVARAPTEASSAKSPGTNSHKESNSLENLSEAEIRQRAQEAVAELKSYNPDEDNQKMLDRSYKRRSNLIPIKQGRRPQNDASHANSGITTPGSQKHGRIVAEVEKVHTGEIQVNLINEELAKSMTAQTTPSAELNQSHSANSRSITPPDSPGKVHVQPETLLTPTEASGVQSNALDIQSKTIETPPESVEQVAQVPEQSIAEQARELGVPTLALKARLEQRKVSHYTQLPTNVLDDLRRVARMLA